MDKIIAANYNFQKIIDSHEWDEPRITIPINEHNSNLYRQCIKCNLLIVSGKALLLWKLSIYSPHLYSTDSMRSCKELVFEDIMK